MKCPHDAKCQVPASLRRTAETDLSERKLDRAEALGGEIPLGAEHVHPVARFARPSIDQMGNAGAVAIGAARLAHRVRVGDDAVEIPHPPGRQPVRFPQATARHAAPVADGAVADDYGVLRKRGGDGRFEVAQRHGPRNDGDAPLGSRADVDEVHRRTVLGFVAHFRTGWASIHPTGQLSRRHRGTVGEMAMISLALLPTRFGGSFRHGDEVCVFCFVML